jgi:two-component system sensor histidine kinase CpxA
MRSLFVKIFLWFWLATILIIGTTLVLISLIEPYRPFREDGRHVKKLAHDGRRAVEILEREGLGALQDFIEGKKRKRGRHFFLFNEKSETVTGRRVRGEAHELVARARESGVTEFLNLGRSLMLARPFYGSDGRSYVIVDEVPRRAHRSPIWRFLNPRFLSVRLLVIFIVASIFCYWLAWYLTAPVRKLRTATQQLASGDLKARVVPNLGSRRDELTDLGHDFDVMAERIEALINSQSRLLRDISHELRSPLARLNVALELARQRSDSEAGESLDRIEREAERMNELIGQLRTLTLLESGAEDMDKAPFDVSSVVKAIAEDADFEARNRNRSVKIVLNENIVIDGSEELLRRAIENTVRNALRYTAEGTEVEISLQRKKINGKEYAVTKVRDHGLGVPESALDSLFQPFYRISDARDRQSGGMGIGLAITDRSVRLHGGTVKAANHPGGGLVIEIVLPVSFQR